ncbi:MAG: NAD(+) diphosphatase [Actinomycetales bacterium]|nr:NAD(+) diphosphatase [Actinomycetales bacterium]
MPHDFNSRLPLSRHSTDRNGVARTRPDLLSELWADEATRVIVMWKGRARIANGALVLLAPSEMDALEFSLELNEDSLRLYLGESLEDTAGEVAGTSFVAVIVSDVQAAVLSAGEEDWSDLRLVAPILTDRDAGLFTQALALANWHMSYGHSPKTGSKTSPDQAGWIRASTVDGAQVFPRTDPAVIVMITDHDDRLLLGNNALWESNRYSLLAGYVEPGESLEAAVIREVFEESGVTVVDPVYLGSQPWPFPASLMLGFHAKLAPGFDAANLTPDGEEILAVRWFTRDELKASTETIILPGPVSIARAMIEHWLGETLDQDVSWLGTR